jgi:Flp pilus assembly protein TadB
MEAIIASICVSVAVIFVALRLQNKAPGVELHDEYKEVKKSVIKENKIKNLVLGCMISVILAYIITGSAFFVLLSIPGGLVVAQWLNNRKDNAKRKLLDTQYIQILSSLLTAMQSGSSPYQALEEIATGLPSPSKEIWIEMLTRARTSDDPKNRYENAIRSVAKDTGWKNLYYIEMAYSVYGKVGGNLVDVFQYLLKSAYEAHSDKKYVQAIVSTNKMSALIISCLPFFFMAMSRLVAPEYAAPLFNTTGGKIVVIVVLIMVVIGNKMVEKMLNNVVQNST